MSRWIKNKDGTNIARCVQPDVFAVSGSGMILFCFDDCHSEGLF